MLIPGYPAGSDITLMNTCYQGKRRDEYGKIKNDFINLTYKDNRTGKKHHHFIYNPTYTFYKLKDGIYTDHNLFFAEIKDCEPIEVLYSDIEKEIANITGNTELFYDNIRNGNRQDNRRLHKIEEILSSDMNIEDYYRRLFAREYTNSVNKLTKAFMDIEVDTKIMRGDFPEPGECPINAVSLINEENNTCYVYILRDNGNPLIEKFENSINANLFSRLKDFIIEKIGGWKQATRFGVINMEYEFIFFDEEIELIYQIFQNVVKLSPDFLEFWNWGFDMNYFIARCEALGHDPIDIMTDPSFEERYLRFYIDERDNAVDPQEKGDFLNISFHTTILDQLIHYASRRKGRSKPDDFKLDTIGLLVAKVRKLDYSHITQSIALFPYLDFELFIFYNIMDVIVQRCIENKTQDLEYVFNKSIMNFTRYHKVHRQSVYLINRFSEEFYNDGLVIGNNINKWNAQPETKFPGALVGDPKNTNDYAKLIVNHRATMIADNLVDYDYKSLYPSITIENNMAPNTQIGRIVMNEQVYEFENRWKDSEYYRAGEYIDNLSCGNIIEFCKRYYHIGGYLDVLYDMAEYYNSIAIPSTPLKYFSNNSGAIEVFCKAPDDWNELVAFDYDPEEDIKPVAFYNKRENGFDDIHSDYKRRV